MMISMYVYTPSVSQLTWELNSAGGEFPVCPHPSDNTHTHTHTHAHVTLIYHHLCIITDILLVGQCYNQHTHMHAHTEGMHAHTEGTHMCMRVPLLPDVI